MFIETKETWLHFKSETTIPSAILIQYYQVADKIEVKLNSLIFWESHSIKLPSW